MKTLEELERLIRYEGNGRIIFLNPENHHWVRMKKDRYDAICSNNKQQEKLINRFEKNYDLFGSYGKECNIRSVYYVITGKCNMQCAFCTMNSGPNVSTEQDFTTNEIQNVLIPKLQSINPRKIIITGGEPLLRDDIVDILKIFAETFGKERVLLQTNGLLLSEKIIKRISKYIRAIEISIENIFANKTLQRKMEALFKCACAENLELSLSFVLDNESRPYLFEAVDLCHKYNGAFTLRVVSMVGRATQDDYQTDFIEPMEILKAYYDFFSYLLENNYLEEKLISGFMDNLQPKKACGAYGKILSIHPDGTTFMCGNFKDKKFSMGNIKTSSMEEICESLRSKLDSTEMKNKFLVDKNNMCKECSEKYFCPGPCRAEGEEYSEYYGYNRSKCLSSKAMLRFSMYYYDKKKTSEENFKALINYIRDILEGRIQLE